MVESMRRVATGALWLFVFTIPWEDLLVIPGVGTASRAVGVLAGMAGIAAIALDRPRHRLIDAHLLMLAFAAWVAASMFWSVRPGESLVFVFTMAQLAVMVLLIWEFGREPAQLRSLLWAFVLGCFVSAVGTFIVFSGSTAEEIRFAAPGFNENDLGTVLALGVAVAWYLSLRSARPWAALLARAYIPVGVLAIILTGTRGALLVVLTAAALIPLTITRLSTRGRLLSLAALAVAFVAVAMMVPPATIDRFQTIPAELASGDLSARRQLWGGAIQVFADHPFVGAGVGVSSIGIERITGLAERAHNSFLSIAADLGIVGLALFCLLLLSLVLGAIRLRQTERLFAVVLLLSIGVAMMSLHLEYRKMTWFVFAVVLGLFPLRQRAEPEPASAVRNQEISAASLSLPGR